MKITSLILYAIEHFHILSIINGSGWLELSLGEDVLLLCITNSWDSYWLNIWIKTNTIPHGVNLFIFFKQEI